jgi:hypothetical protein
LTGLSFSKIIENRRSVSESNFWSDGAEESLGDDDDIPF